jgi:hypothetical protein
VQNSPKEKEFVNAQNVIRDSYQ